MRCWLLGVSACLVLTCARSGEELAHAESPPASAVRSSGKADARGARSSKADQRRQGSVEPAAVMLPAAAPKATENGVGRASLKAFFAALRELGSGARSGHVRLLWLGDSHTAADYLSGAVRSALSERFGDGGPGFVRIGTKPYRHDGLKIGRDGNWNVDPDPPARRAPQDDGVFGFAGTRAQPAAGASFSVELGTRLPGSADETARFELSYVLPPRARFDVLLGDRRVSVSEASPAAVAPSGISHLSLSAPLHSRLLIQHRAGSPRLLGLVIERSSGSGLVLDTAGIDGARLETPLAWNEAAFVAEVARRAPELFVLAYGTNEAFDALRVEKYEAQLGELVRRLRRGAPNASCLVLGPTDAPLGEGSVPRVMEVAGALGRAAAQLDCSFVSLQQLMGGEGSFARGMKAKERLCQLDKLHLTPRGYQELGRALAQLLLDAYDAGRTDI